MVSDLTWIISDTTDELQFTYSGAGTARLPKVESEIKTIAFIEDVQSAIDLTENSVVVTDGDGNLEAKEFNSSGTGYLKQDGSWATPLNYYPTTFDWIGGDTSGPTGSLTGGSMPAVSFDPIPYASSDASGVVTTGPQTFGGLKTFNDNIELGEGNPTWTIDDIPITNILTFKKWRYTS